MPKKVKLRPSVSTENAFDHTAGAIGRCAGQAALLCTLARAQSYDSTDEAEKAYRGQEVEEKELDPDFNPNDGGHHVGFVDAWKALEALDLSEWTRLPVWTFLQAFIAVIRDVGPKQYAWRTAWELLRPRLCAIDRPDDAAKLYWECNAHAKLLAGKIARPPALSELLFGVESENDGKPLPVSADGIPPHRPNAFCWSSDEGSLRAGSKTKVLFPPGKRRSPEQEAILDLFENAEWPVEIEVSELSHVTMQRLNKRICNAGLKLVFHGNGRGTGIRRTSS